MKSRTCVSPTTNYSRLKACNLLLQPYVNLSLQPPCIITSLTLVMSMVTDSQTDVNMCVHLFNIYKKVFLKHIFFFSQQLVLPLQALLCLPGPGLSPVPQRRPSGWRWGRVQADTLLCLRAWASWKCALQGAKQSSWPLP